MIKIFGSETSPFVRHCRIACLQEGLAHELVLADYAASAAHSPTQKVPYMEENGLILTDSSAILMYIRHRAGKTFLPTVHEAELYFMADTAADTAVNLFLMEKDGVTNTPYLQRQTDRLKSSFNTMDQILAKWEASNWNDGVLRLAVLMGWVKYRNRFSMAEYKNLQKMFGKFQEDPLFAKTNPPPLP